ncbi:unnamed protein product [Ceutorhynchus assimilis]|uniref:RNA-binding protein 25 n=1 Tax=Ceutorhynchus assimilis TaxID=467358 RepID=A0A9N9MQ46_9CUCU|nr:unnamed protein product [Ceutorhynchus assimilis]
MSFPGRPPMMPGLPMQPMYAMPIGAPAPGLMPAVMPMQHVAGAPQIRAFPKLNPNRHEPLREGPAVTVFVGNITERAPETMIRQILAACGHVLSWKKVKAFGFCELAGPDAGLRAVRLLHDLMVHDKRLVAKVDAKTQAVLDEYKADRRKRQRSSPLQDENEEEELDEESQYLDALSRDRIKQILTDYQEEMNNYDHKKEGEGYLFQVMTAWNKVLAEAEVEEEKRDLISREIGKFREIMKKQEEEREVKKKEKNKEHEKSPSRSPSPKRKEKEEKKKRRSRSRSHEHHEKSRERDRDREREREKERERERDRERERERERDRDRERERERDKEKDRERERVDKLSTKELMREKEMEEEAKEKKKAERKAKEKEAAYQERLREWEIRERRKAKEYEKERERERIKEEEREREAKRLKEFLEDYDDEKDDIKYYKGRDLQRRIAERLKEAESDTRDRLKEKEEIEELKRRVYAENHEDADAVFAKMKQEREDQYKPKLLIDVNLEHWKQKEREKERELERQRARERERQREIERDRRHREERDKYVIAQAAKELESIKAEPIDSDSDMDTSHFSPPPPEADNASVSNDNSDSAQWTQVQAPDEDSRQSFTSPVDLPQTPTTTGMKITLSKPGVLSNNALSPSQSRKKRLDLRDVFNPDEDDSDILVKKRKLVPLDYNEDKNVKKDKLDESKSQEEKRKHIKTLISKIPTEKVDLFEYKLDWSQLDSSIMDKKIRPWINKKIIEYIGEPEPTLVDFICNKVLAGSLPQTILEDVQMVLDEEAEVFVVKMWRLLIYEVEAKKLGLIK